MIDQEVSRDVLEHATRDIFEMMIFMGVERVDPTEFKHLDGNSLLGTITFNGGIEGCFGFCCSDASAKAVAASMLGLDPDDEVADQDVNDADWGGRQYGDGKYQGGPVGFSRCACLYSHGYPGTGD